MVGDVPLKPRSARPRIERCASRAAGTSGRSLTTSSSSPRCGRLRSSPICRRAPPATWATPAAAVPVRSSVRARRRARRADGPRARPRIRDGCQSVRRARASSSSTGSPPRPSAAWRPAAPRRGSRTRACSVVGGTVLRPAQHDDVADLRARLGGSLPPASPRPRGADRIRPRHRSVGVARRPPIDYGRHSHHMQLRRA